ncbi:MAG TPA: HAMP domain-containing sensor histidine kinase, partial [Candidatus Binataceae bacterium]|nr:HAMP domain-containing sensor histidine kinase [Candidatus Binataceae bacterium]
VIDFFQTVADLLGSALEIDHLRSELRLAGENARCAAAQMTAFIANASHEIRSPLNVILGYWDLVSERLCEIGDPSVPAWRAAVERAGSRLVGTVDDILDFSRLESGAVRIKTEALRIAPIVESVARTAAPVAAVKKIGLSCAIDAPDLIVRADSRSLEVALTKLVGNAIKFTDHGAVSIRLARETDRTARLEICDSGVGIAADYIPHLFEPFSQESANYARPFEGIGLGLAIARHYLELNGAEIAVHSTKGHGTTFTIRLPGSQVARPSSLQPSGIVTAAARAARRPAR